MNAAARIGLGTAQFGLDYGVSNRLGQPSETEVDAILNFAAEMGVGLIDTAPSYGDAEILIGRYRPREHRFRIISKTPPIAESVIEKRHAAIVVDTIARSCERLQVAKLDGVLLHHAADLKKAGWQHLVDGVREAQSRGSVERIGISVYDPEELAQAESRLGFDLIQLPCNAFDRRLIVDGRLERLKSLQTEIHARSAFLQGLLLMRPTELPEYFSPVQPQLARLQADWSAQGLSPLAGCLAFILAQRQIDAVIVGVNAVAELAGIKSALAQISAMQFDAPAIEDIDSRYLDPRGWPISTRQEPPVEQRP
jgi:aryl-alcohol dehydrogenase-like predicted oxidoreductase